MLSTHYRERVSAGILVKTVLKAFPDFSVSAARFSLPIEWDCFSAHAIREIQKWLTSDCSIDELNSTESMSQIQSKLKTVLEEEVEESKDLEEVLDEAHGMMDIEPATGLVSRADLTYKAPVSQEDRVEHPQWVVSLLKSIEVDQTPLSDVFMSSLQHCLDVSWEHRHGSFVVLSAFLQQYHFGPEVGAFVLNDFR